jgi:hypothetical protein
MKGKSWTQAQLQIQSSPQITFLLQHLVYQGVVQLYQSSTPLSLPCQNLHAATLQAIRLSD